MPSNPRDVFEQMMMQETQKIDTTTPKEEQPIKAKDKRTLEQVYRDCNFESETKSFSDFMQCQMHKSNKMVLPHAIVSESNFFFYSRGRDMWKLNGDFRDDLEDQCRVQLEQADRL